MNEGGAAIAGGRAVATTRRSGFQPAKLQRFSFRRSAGLQACFTADLKVRTTPEWKTLQPDGVSNGTVNSDCAARSTNALHTVRAAGRRHALRSCVGRRNNRRRIDAVAGADLTG